MPTVGEFISNLLEKAGYDTTAETLKPALGITIPMPDDALEAANSKLVTLEYAKNSKEVKDHHLSKFIQGTDRNINDKLAAMGLSQAERDEIFTGNGSFTSRIEKAFEKLDNIAKEAAKASGKKSPEEIETFKKQIETLQTDLAKAKNDHLTETSTLRSTFENEKLNDEITRSFLSKQWSANYPEEIRSDIARVALEKKLSSENAKIVRDAQTGKLKLAPADNLEGEYFDKSHKKVSFTEFTDGLMSEYKFSAVTPPGGQAAAQITPTVVTQPVPQAASKNRTRDMLNQSMADQGMS